MVNHNVALANHNVALARNHKVSFLGDANRFFPYAEVCVAHSYNNAQYFQRWDSIQGDKLKSRLSLDQFLISRPLCLFMVTT
jgi:hypothetical protein